MGKQDKFERIYPYDFVFRVSWDATGITMIIPADNLEKAEKRLKYELRRMIGGEWVQRIKHLETRERINPIA